MIRSARREKDTTADSHDAITSRWQKAERHDRHSSKHVMEVMRLPDRTGTVARLDKITQRRGSQILGLVQIKAVEGS